MVVMDTFSLLGESALRAAGSVGPWADFLENHLVALKHSDWQASNEYPWLSQCLSYV